MTVLRHFPTAQAIRHRAAIAALALTLCPAPVAAQRVLHNSTREAQARALAEVVDALAGAGAFDVQLKNLEELSNQQIDITLRWQDVRMRAAINGFSTWRDMTRLFARVDTAIAPALDPSAASAVAQARLAEIRARQKAIAAALKDLSGSEQTAPGVLDNLFSHLGDVTDIVEFAESTVLKGNPAMVSALNEAVAALAQIEQLYSTAKAIITSHRGVQVTAASLAPHPLAIELELLKIEQQHLAAVGLIRARGALETGALKEALDRAAAFVTALGEPEDRRIEESLTMWAAGKEREKLEFAVLAIHEAGAIAAQQETAAELAALRRTQAERRTAIQRVAVTARASETAVRAATHRLAAYWSAGFKPRDAAELLFNLSAALSLPIIAGK